MFLERRKKKIPWKREKMNGLNLYFASNIRHSMHAIYIKMPNNTMKEYWMPYDFLGL